MSRSCRAPVRPFSIALRRLQGKRTVATIFDVEDGQRAIVRVQAPDIDSTRIPLRLLSQPIRIESEGLLS